MNLQEVGSVALRSRHVVGALEGPSNVGDYVDEHVSVIRNFVVPINDLDADELSEGEADASIDHVHDPLLGQVLDFLLLWEVGWQS